MVATVGHNKACGWQCWPEAAAQCPCLVPARCQIAPTPACMHPVGHGCAGVGNVCVVWVPCRVCVARYAEARLNATPPVYDDDSDDDMHPPIKNPFKVSPDPVINPFHRPSDD